MFRKFSRFFFLFCTLNQVISIPDYYWREYTGSIPNDAVSGGKDLNGQDVYIGQAYLKNEGVMPVQIYPGIKEVYVPRLGIKKIDRYIKILCGPQENFYWMMASFDTLHITLLNKHAVIGGHQDGFGTMNVGRISYLGEAKIGKIQSYNLNNAYFYFNDNGTEKRSSSYEVLIYNDEEVRAT